MRAWEKWGLSAPEHWVGEFAAIVWDAADHRLVAARDALGLRTLNFHITPTRLVVASAPRGIFASGGIARVLDEQKVAETLTYLYGDPSRSFFKDICRLAPAHLLIVDPAGWTTRRY